MPRTESPLLLKCLSRSWSTAHPASHRTPPVKDVVNFLNKKKLSSQIAARLTTIVISRGITDTLIEVLPNLTNPSGELESFDGVALLETLSTTWSYAVVVSSIARSTLINRLPSFRDPFDPLVNKLKSLDLPSSIERSVPSVTTPLELLSTSIRVVVTPSPDTSKIDFLPLVQLTNYKFYAETSLLADSLVDLELQKPRKPRKPARQPRPSPLPVTVPINNPMSFRRSPRAPKPPQSPHFQLTKLGRNGPNSSGPELSRRRACSNKPTHINPNSPRASLPPASPSAAPVGSLSKLSLGNQARTSGGNPSISDRVVKGTGYTEVVDLDSDDDVAPDSDVVEVNVHSDYDSPSSAPFIESAHRENIKTRPARNPGFDPDKFRQKLEEKQKGQREAFHEIDISDTMPLPPPSDTFYAREQNRQRKKQERDQKRKANREKREERRRDEDRKRREQKLKKVKRSNLTSITDDDDSGQHEPRVKKARLHSASDSSEGHGVEGAAPVDLIDLVDDVELKQETQILSSADEYEIRRSKLMDTIKGHTTDLSSRDLTKIENFLKGGDVFGRHDAIDILLHHDCAKSGNHHYLRLIKEPRGVEQVFRTSVF